MTGTREYIVFTRGPTVNDLFPGDPQLCYEDPGVPFSTLMERSTLMLPRAGLGTVPTLYRGGSVGDRVDICLSILLVDGTISPRVDVLKV